MTINIAYLDVEKFMSLITPEPNSGCWLWLGRVDKDGYGRLSIGGVARFAHRVMVTHVTGIDPGRFIVCHHCDNPACVNPDHLYCGTQATNAADRVARSRQARGRRIKNSKLVDGEVAAIIASSEPASLLAIRFGVSLANVNKIKNGKLWRHVFDAVDVSRRAA